MLLDRKQLLSGQVYISFDHFSHTGFGKSFPQPVWPSPPPCIGFVHFLLIRYSMDDYCGVDTAWWMQTESTTNPPVSDVKRFIHTEGSHLQCLSQKAFPLPSQR